MSASKRVLAKPKCRKEPITPEMLQLLAESLKDKSCIASSRTLALCPIGFAGFLRFSELCSVRLYSSHCSLFLESSKTDQLREGAWINIAKIRQSYMSRCRPLEILSRSWNQAWWRLPLFRALAPPKSYEKVCQHDTSYTRAREIVKEAFKDITDVSKISLHSLRSGGAANAGIPDRLFKRHGWWASENAKDCYVNNLESLLSVSRSLGIGKPSPAGSKDCGP